MCSVKSTGFAMSDGARRVRTGGRRRAAGLALAVGMALAATATQAATFIAYTPYQFALNPGEVLVTNFDGPSISLASGFTASGTATTMTGFSDTGAAPATSATTHDTSQYLSVAPGQTFALTSPALSEISFYVGSLDPFNRITFTGAGGFSQSFTGADLATAAGGLASGDQTAAASNGRYSFTFGQAITGVQLASSSPSFEVSNIGAIPGLALLPEPGPWALMILGFGGLGVSLRAHRRRAPTVA
jgi:hypothetical protein